MSLALVRRLYDYTVWANGLVFDAATGLSDEELRRDLGSSFPSLLDTLEHVVAAEWIWLERWRGVSPSEPPDWWGDPKLGFLRGKLRQIEAEREGYLASLGEADLRRVVAYRLMNGEAGEGPLVDLLLHPVNHSTYHRGQVVTMLRQLGHEPPATDLLWYTDP